MLSTHATLKGNGLSVTSLLDELYSDLIDTSNNLDLSQQSLQLHFANKLQAMLKDEKLHLEH